MPRHRPTPHGARNRARMINNATFDKASQATKIDPTPERLLKNDYEKVGSKRRRVDTLLTLRRSEDIDAECETTAERWIIDYEFSQFAYLECTKDPLPSDYIKGDVHTWAIARGRASERISYIREILGKNAHKWLEMLLANRMSFSAIADTLLPEVDKTNARKAIKQQAVMLLNILLNAYRAARDLQKNKKE